MNQIRQFETGATRDTENGKFDYEGFINPLVTYEYGKYMHKHRKQSDGNLRASDNWQKGINRDAYIKCLVRHCEDLKCLHRGYFVYKIREIGAEHTIVSVEEIKDLPSNWTITTFKDALCAIIFNASGYMLELILRRF